MFSYIQYAYKSFCNKPDDKSNAANQVTTQLPQTRKPDGYKNSQSSSLKFK